MSKPSIWGSREKSPELASRLNILPQTSHWERGLRDPSKYPHSPCEVLSSWLNPSWAPNDCFFEKYLFLALLRRLSFFFRKFDRGSVNRTGYGRCEGPHTTTNFNGIRKAKKFWITVPFINAIRSFSITFPTIIGSEFFTFYSQDLAMVKIVTWKFQYIKKIVP